MRISDWSSDVCSSDLHPDLHVGRAGRAGVEDILQRAQIIFPPDRFGKRKKAYEHRRHDKHVRDAVLLDELPRPLGVEPAPEHPKAVAAHRGKRAEVRGGLIKRRRPPPAQPGPQPINPTDIGTEPRRARGWQYV